MINWTDPVADLESLLVLTTLPNTCHPLQDNFHCSGSRLKSTSPCIELQLGRPLSIFFYLQLPQGSTWIVGRTLDSHTPCPNSHLCISRLQSGTASEHLLRMKWLRLINHNTSMAHTMARKMPHTPPRELQAVTWLRTMGRVLPRYHTLHPASRLQLHRQLREPRYMDNNRLVVNLRVPSGAAKMPWLQLKIHHKERVRMI